MTDVLSAEDIKKAVGAFSGECLIFFLSFLFFFLLPFVSPAQDVVHLFKLGEDYS